MVTGEASGDLHGARVVEALRARRPDVQVDAVGSDHLQAAGATLIADSKVISVIGLVEALRILPAAFRLRRTILDHVDRQKPDLALLIDSPDFNLRLAPKLKQRGVRVAYFISPQVWAWRSSRVHQIREVVDRMLVLFPFEVEFYRQHDVPVEAVGHPLVDEVPHIEQGERAAERQRVVALLPGSRPSEVSRLLPLMVQCGRGLIEQGHRVLLIVAPTLDRQRLEAQLRELDAPQQIEWVVRDRFESLAGCDLAICASGTATLEVGLLGVPMVVVYRVNALTYALGRRLVKVPHIALVNLVLGDRVVPELIQHDATVERVLAEVTPLLADDDALAARRRALEPLRERLGTSGAAERAARSIDQLLGTLLEAEG